MVRPSIPHEERRSIRMRVSPKLVAVVGISFDEKADLTGRTLFQSLECENLHQIGPADLSYRLRVGTRGGRDRSVIE